MRLLPNGNVEITVQLLPDAYAALVAIGRRDRLNRAEVVNVAVTLLNMISEGASADGKPLGDAARGDHQAAVKSATPNE